MNIVEDFVRATEGLPSPEIHRRWIGISLVSAALSRRVWTELIDGADVVYGNMFVNLVGPPGVGKSFPMKPAKGLLEGSLPSKVALSAQKATPQGLVTDLARVFPDSPNIDRSYALWLTELMTFLNAEDAGHMANLADLWDNGKVWVALTKGDIRPDKDGHYREPESVFRPYVTILGGITPDMLQQSLSGAIGLGLSSRTIFAYSDEEIMPDYFTPRQGKNLLMEQLAQRDLPSVLQFKGRALFVPEAQQEFLTFLQSARESKGKTSAGMANYYARRGLHVAKLALVFAAARHPQRVRIEPEDLKLAAEALHQTEPAMARLLGASGSNQFLGAEETALRQLKAIGRSTLFEFEVRHALHNSIASHLIGVVLEEMIASKRLILKGGKTPSRQFGLGANA